MIELRDISKEQAKQEVHDLLISNSKPIDHGVIADELRLSLELVASVCDDLIEDKLIEFTWENHREILC